MVSRPARCRNRGAVFAGSRRVRMLAGLSSDARQVESRRSTRQRSAGERRALERERRGRWKIGKRCAIHAEQAQDATHSLPWNIASVVPWLGSPFKTGQQISDVVAGLATDVLEPSVHVGEALSPDQLLAGNGRVDVQLLRDAAPKLSEISTAANDLDARAAAISEPKYLSVMRDARAALQAQISDLSGLLDNTALAARLAPSMMGADGPRTYFMGFQTNAEARGTGGLLGGFGILRFDNGTATVDTWGETSS